MNLRGQDDLKKEARKPVAPTAAPTKPLLMLPVGETNAWSVWLGLAFLPFPKSSTSSSWWSISTFSGGDVVGNEFARVVARGCLRQKQFETRKMPV